MPCAPAALTVMAPEFVTVVRVFPVLLLPLLPLQSRTRMPDFQEAFPPVSDIVMEPEFVTIVSPEPRASISRPH